MRDRRQLDVALSRTGGGLHPAGREGRSRPGALLHITDHHLVVTVVQVGPPLGLEAGVVRDQSREGREGSVDDTGHSRPTDIQHQVTLLHPVPHSTVNIHQPLVERLQRLWSKLTVKVKAFRQELGESLDVTSQTLD